MPNISRWLAGKSACGHQRVYHFGQWTSISPQRGVVWTEGRVWTHTHTHPCGEGGFWQCPRFCLVLNDPIIQSMNVSLVKFWVTPAKKNDDFGRLDIIWYWNWRTTDVVYPPKNMKRGYLPSKHDMHLCFRCVFTHMYIYI